MAETGLSFLTLIAALIYAEIDRYKIHPSKSLGES